MEFALYGYRLKGYHDIVTIHVCKVTRTRSNGILKEPLCNSDTVSYYVEDGLLGHPEFLTQKEASELKVENIAPDLIVPIFTKYRSNCYQHKGASFKMCQHCRRILGEYDLEALGQFKKDKCKHQLGYTTKKEEIKPNKQVTRKEIKIMDVEFGGYAAIHLDGSVAQMELDADGKVQRAMDKHSIRTELDHEFINFSEETFCATDATLDGLLTYLAENIYLSGSEDEVIQDIRDGKLIIVKVETIPLDIVIEEKVTRHVTRFEENK